MLLMFAVSFVSVFLRAFQQKNVMGDHYVWITPVSFGMAVAQALTVLIIVDQGLWAIIPMGLGGASGAMLAMYTHGRYVHK